jgi:hypothetical protein
MTAPAMSVTTNNGRYYVHPSRRKSVPSVTNIKNIKAIDGLKYSYARGAAEFAVDNSDAWKNLDRESAIRLIKGAPDQRGPNSPSSVGDTVHNWIDRYIKGERISEHEIGQAVITARRMWGQFGNFVGRYSQAPYNLEFLDSEFTVWSDAHDYAGTADLALRIAGKLILADTKTGKQPWPDMALQLAALSHADFILTPEGEQREMPKWDAFAILHLRPMSFALIPVYNIDQAFQAFLGLKAVFDWEVNCGDKTLGYAPRVGTKESQALAT